VIRAKLHGQSGYIFIIVEADRSACMMPIRGSIVGPPFSATSINARIAACHSGEPCWRQRTNVEAPSGTNPDDHYGQRKGDTNRATNRRERR
jgi:hypothetical protein